jgi:hypothetical protein
MHDVQYSRHLCCADTSRTQRIPYPVRIGYRDAWDTRWIRIRPHYLKSDAYTCRYEYPYVYSVLDTARLAFLAQLVLSTLNPTPTRRRALHPPPLHRTGARLLCRRPASPAASPGQDRHDSSAATPSPCTRHTAPLRWR